MADTDPNRDWFTVQGVKGCAIVAESYEANTATVRNLLVYPPHGDQPLIAVSSEQWADPRHGNALLARLWATAAYGDGHDDAYGPEFVFRLPAGAVHCALDGSHLRVVGAGGVELEGAFWSSEEWQEDPEGVLGAVLGAAVLCAGRTVSL